MKNEIERLKEFIRNNPPLDEKGEPEFWYEGTWAGFLDTSLPGWQEILGDTRSWEKLKEVKPRSSYDKLLKVLLKYAPDEVLVEYLKSNINDEWKASLYVILENDGEKLSSNLWKLLDNKAKNRILSKVQDRVKVDRHNITLHHILEILLPIPELIEDPALARKKEHSLQQGKFQLSYPPLQVAFYETSDILHPLWIKLTEVIKEANDDEFIKITKEHEDKFRYILNKKFEKVKSLVESLREKKYLPKENVMFDPSLLLDYKKSKNVYNFIKEYSEEFNFFLSRSFYDALKEYQTSNTYKKWYAIVHFFEIDETVSPKKLYKEIEKHKRYITFFEISYNVYEKKYRYLFENLSKSIENEKLRKILVEEWVFLQEFSWIVAKSKKVFEKFKEAGAIVLEVSKKALDMSIEKLARHKLNKSNDEILSTIEKLRGLGKWIAHGVITGIGATTPNPLLGALISYLIGEGFFVLIDPEEIIDIRETEYGDGV